MGRVITLKYRGTCTSCGVSLPKGVRALWHGRGKVRCLDCDVSSMLATKATERADTRTAYEQGDRSPGAIASHYDRYGIYTQDGQRIGSSCGCIDYPCCGH